MKYYYGVYFSPSSTALSIHRKSVLTMASALSSNRSQESLLHCTLSLQRHLPYLLIFPPLKLSQFFPDGLYVSSSFASLMSSSHKQVTRSRLTSRYAPIAEAATSLTDVSTSSLVASSATAIEIPRERLIYKRELRSRRGDLQGVNVSVSCHMMV